MIEGLSQKEHEWLENEERRRNGLPPLLPELKQLGGLVSVALCLTVVTMVSAFCYFYPPRAMTDEEYKAMRCGSPDLFGPCENIKTK